MSDYTIFGLVIYFAVFLQVLGLAFAVIIDPYISRKHGRVILINTVLTTLLIVQNYWDTEFALEPARWHDRIITGVIGYSLRPLIIVMWLYLTRKNQKLIIAWVLVAINTIIHCTAFFTNICFTIDENNSFHRGPLGYTCHIVSALLLLYLLWLSGDAFIALTGKNRSNIQTGPMPGANGTASSGQMGGGQLSNGQARQSSSPVDWRYEVARYRYGLEGLIPVWCALVIVGAVEMDSRIYSPNLNISFLTMAIVSCNLFYYIWLHLNFVREHEDDLMAHQRVQIMVSQIQPHFLYNTLSTIQALCHSDPEKAADTVEKFGTYLRQNIDSLNQTELIPFNKELEHTRVYVDIEQIRFPSISVRYDIDDVKDVDFDLPALTIQPMVENAIRHGVRSRKHGEIVVAAHKVDDNYVITIRDNGKGFDTSLLMNQDNSHIGIQNVKERIEDQCKGTFIIESTPGEGTLVTFRIPEM